MDSGTKVFRAYVSQWDDRFTHWIDEGVVTEIVSDGKVVVRHSSGILEPIDGRWRDTKIAAQRDIYTAMVQFIGKLQAKADEMADEILHADLTTEERAA
jgi:hypothetical protein